MAEGLQISVGASLFGGNRDHRLNVVCGDGGTGKSVFLNTIAKALGDYAGAMPASVLASKGNDHPTGLAGIVDKRFVVVPEVSGGMWKEETLKTITGGDAIPVRYMRQDFFRGQAGVYAMGEHEFSRQHFAWWTTQSSDASEYGPSPTSL